MMRKRFQWYFLSAVIISILFITLFPVWTLEVKNKKRGEVFFRERINPGEVFRFRYIHSVSKTPVEGFFEVEKDGFLRIVETRFPSYGPGLPHAEGEKVLGEGWISVKGETKLERFTFLFSPLNHPFLMLKGRELELTSKMNEGEVLEVYIRRYPLVLLFLFRA